MSNEKRVKYYMIDAFTDQAFKGNPAAVCLLDDHKSDEWLQSVASEFNVSIACFLQSVSADDNRSSTPRFHLRWFTPVTEVKLCGHATVAAAHTVFTHLQSDASIVEFDTLSGLLTVKKIEGETLGEKGVFIEIDFPAVATTEFNTEEFELLRNGLGGPLIVDVKRTAVLDDIMVELKSLKDVEEVEPVANELLKCTGRGVIVTAKCPPESGFDFCSRFFAPKYGIKEDPVCGTAHCALVTYWSEKLRKYDMIAYAASRRGGVLALHLNKENERLFIRGKAITVMEGCILIM